MSVSDLMEAMAAAGAPMEAIIIAVRALEAKDAEIIARDAEVAEKRAKDAARKRAERATDSPKNVLGLSKDTAGTIQDSPFPAPFLDKEKGTQKEINPTPTHTPGEVIPPARKGNPFPMVEGANPQHWRDFLENRKRKRLPNTATAHAKLLREIEKFTDDDWPPPRLIEHAAASGWAGIYDPRPKDFQNGHQPLRRQQSDTIRDPVLAAIASRAGMG